jgi:putative oxidoreductase
MFDLEKWSPNALAALRIITALLLVEHGTMKLPRFPAALPGVPTLLPTIFLATAIIEIVGGALVTIGLLARAAPFICSGEGAVAYFMFHAPRSFWSVVNNGDATILFCLVFFYLVFAGAGAWSVDGSLSPSRWARRPERSFARKCTETEPSCTIRAH